MDQVSSGIPDYTGYAFVSEAIPDAAPGTVFSKRRYMAFIPSDSRVEWDDQKNEAVIKSNQICFRILKKEPIELGKPLSYSNKWIVINLEDEIQKQILRNFKPLGKFVIDDEGKYCPWIPGKKSVLKNLDSSEVGSEVLNLIKKSEAEFIAAIS